MSSCALVPSASAAWQSGQPVLNKTPPKTSNKDGSKESHSSENVLASGDNFKAPANFSELNSCLINFFKQERLIEHLGYRVLESAGAVILQTGFDLFVGSLAGHVANQVLLGAGLKQSAGRAISLSVTALCMLSNIAALTFCEKEENSTTMVDEAWDERVASIKRAVEEKEKSAEDLTPPTATPLVEQDVLVKQDVWSNLKAVGANWERSLFLGIKHIFNYMNQPLPRFFGRLRDWCVVAALAICLTSLGLGLGGVSPGLAMYIGIWTLKMVLIPIISGFNNSIWPAVDKLFSAKCGQPVVAATFQAIGFGLKLTLFPFLSETLTRGFVMLTGMLSLSLVVQACLVGAVLLTGAVMIWFAHYQIWKNYDIKQLKKAKDKGIDTGEKGKMKNRRSLSCGNIMLTYSLDEKTQSEQDSVLPKKIKALSKSKSVDGRSVSINPRSGG